MNEYKAQIAVVGGGASGMSAAVSAAEAGANVVILEANEAVGGNGLFPRGIFAVDSHIQRRKLVFADPDEMFRSAMEHSHWKIDPRIVRALIDLSGDTIKWLEDKGVPFSDVVHHLPNQNPEVYHITEMPATAGRAVIKALESFCGRNGVSVLTGMRGKKLALDKNGAVEGIICEEKNGEQVSVSADKVILCTGGFAGNPDLVSKFYPGYNPEIVAAGGGMRHCGDGVVMAMDAGADVEGNFAMEISAPRIKGFEPLNVIIRKPYNVWLNKFGLRFADEGITYNFAQAANACLRQPDGLVWVVFDQNCIERALSDGQDIIELIHSSPSAIEKFPQAIIEAQKDGILKVSETLSGLAGMIGCPKEVLENSLGEYNHFCEHNRDAIFAKKRGFLQKLDSPPFYAIKAGADMLITHGGIRVNERCEALDCNFDPIPNLYVAGVDFGGADADVYNVVMSGHGFGFAVNSGRIAGKNAAVSLK